MRHGYLLAFRLGGTAMLARYSTPNRSFVDFTAAPASDGDPAAGGGMPDGRLVPSCLHLVIIRTWTEQLRNTIPENRQPMARGKVQEHRRIAAGHYVAGR